MNTIWAKGNIVMPISKKLKIIAEGFVGYGTANIDTTLYRYEVGGMANNHIEWYNSFPGLEYLEHGSNNVWIAKLSPRYEFYKNNFITATFAITAMDNIFENLFIKADRMYTGVGIKYGFNSMFGPLEISADYAFNSYNTNYFISLGYWF
jgi:NTE family protein